MVLQGWGILSGTATAVVMLALVVALALTIQRSLHRAPEYGVTVVWALLGVLVANLTAAPIVSLLAGAGVAFVAIGTWRVAR